MTKTADTGTRSKRSESDRSHPQFAPVSESGAPKNTDLQSRLGNRSMQRLLAAHFPQPSDIGSDSGARSPTPSSEAARTAVDYQSVPEGITPVDPNPALALMDEQPDGGGGEGGGAPIIATQAAPQPGIATPTQTAAAQPTANIGTRVRAPTTPTAMTPDRIPPRVDFPVQVTVGNLQIPMAPVQLSVLGSGGNNGAATLDGAASANLYGSGTVNLRGTAQTAPGNAGNLQLVATWAGRQLAIGNRFSVAAIPQNMVLVRQTALSGASRGFVVDQSWSSDSGNLSDLNEAQVSEVVEYVSSTGIFAGLGASNSGYLSATGGSLTDTHSTPASVLTGPGSRTANQVEIFLDRRTGVTDIPMRNSGFVIQRDVTSQAHPNGGTAYQITTSKSGAAVTVNQGTGAARRSFSVSAGSGNFSLPQWA